MKNILLFATATIISLWVAAQPCAGKRYANDVFTNLVMDSAIHYGFNLNEDGSGDSLTLDFYQPANDTAKIRPLIIWAHGGAFIDGSRQDSDMVSLSQHFAKKGFACASINYRLVANPFNLIGDTTAMTEAVIRAAQDMKAAIRFFYKDRLTADRYKIDTTNIFIGGSSAGAFTSLHVAYLKRNCQIYPYLGGASLSDSVQLAQLEGLDGYSGNQCYSSKINGVINLCGALGVYAWLEKGDIPLCSMHGTLDGTVPYGSGEVILSGIPVIHVDGSRMIYQQAQTVSVQNNFYTWLGAGHMPYYGNTPSALLYMDTTVNFVRDFLIGRLGIACSDLQPADTPYGNASLYAYTPCTGNTAPSNCSLLGIQNQAGNLFEKIYPNPSANSITVFFNNSISVNPVYSIELLDRTGRRVKMDTCLQTSYKLEKDNLEAGIYFLKVCDKVGNTSVKKIIFE